MKYEQLETEKGKKNNFHVFRMELFRAFCMFRPDTQAPSTTIKNFSYDDEINI